MLEFLWTCIDVYVPFVKGYSDRWRGQMKSTFEVHVSPYYLLGSLEVSIISYKPTLRNNWVSKDTEGLTKKETKDTRGLTIHIEYRIGIFSIPILKQSRSKQSKANQGKAKQTKQSKAKQTKPKGTDGICLLWLFCKRSSILICVTCKSYVVLHPAE